MHVHVAVMFATALCGCMLLAIFGTMLDVSVLVHNGLLLWQVGMLLVLLSPGVTLWQLAGVGALL